MLTRLGEFKEAVAHFQLAAEVKPDFAIARTNLANARAIVDAATK